MDIESTADFFWSDPQVRAATIGSCALVITALISGLGVWITNKANRENHKTTLITNREHIVANMRQEWGGKLREEVAFFVLKCVSLKNMIADNEANWEKIEAALGEIDYTQYKIILRLNPNDKDEPHMKLFESIVGLRDSTIELSKNRLEENFKTESYEKFNEFKNEVLVLTKKILKSNWEKVKQEK